MEADKRINWIEARILYSLKPFTSNINSQINLPNNRPFLTAFLRRSSRRILEISSSSLGDVSFSHSTTSRNIIKSQYFIKYPHINIVQRKDLHESILSLDITSSSIQDIDWIILNLFVPYLLGGDQNKVLLSLGNVFDLTRAFINTLAPDFTLPQIIIPRQFHQSTPNLSSLFEDLASSWLCGIRHALVSPADNFLVSKNNHSSPIHEIKFLKQKVETYTKICRLFRSEIFVYVYQLLKCNKSWIIKTIQDLFESTNELLNESKGLLVYLYPLEKWLHMCLDHTPSLRHKYIKPICRIVYLVWTECAFYQDQSHFNSLLSGVIGFVLELVQGYFPEDLFSDPLQSIDKIQSALFLCYAFQGSYIDAKIEADHRLDRFRDDMRLEVDALPEALRSKHELDKIRKSLPCKWPSRKDKIYQKFAKTVNRLQDLLEIVKTLFDFEDIKVIVQNGKDFSETFKEYLGDIHSKFLACMKPILKIETNLFDLDQNENFERVFFAFRNQIEELESRIITILKSYLVPSCDLLNLRRMLLFESLLSRTKIRISMLEFFSKLIQNLRAHISDVQSLVSEHKDSRGFHHFIPNPISIFLYFQALEHRLETPYKLLLQISPDLFNVSESHPAFEEYNSVKKRLEKLSDDFQFIQPDISEDLHHLLRSPILISTGDNQTPAPSFQPWILHDIYIAEYIVKLGHSTSMIPNSILTLLDRTTNMELYPQISKLFHAIHKFDKIWNSRTSPKYRLFTQQIQDCKQLVERGLTEVTWESVVLKDFLQQFISAVFTNLDHSLNQTEQALNSIKSTVHSWRSQSNDLFGTAPPYTVQPLNELSQKLKVNSAEYDNFIIRSQEKILQILTNLSNSFYISTNSAQWKQFLQYIDQMVYRGITSQTSKSFSSIQLYLSPLQSGSESTSMRGLFSVDLKITGDTLSFHPSLYPKGQSSSLVEHIKLWVTGVYKRNINIHPFALPKHTFIESLKNDSFFTNLINDFDFILLDDLRNCHVILHKFSQYAFLWNNDCNSYFRSFISPRANSPDNPTLSGSIDMPLDTSQGSPNSSARLNEYAFLYPNLYAQTQGNFKGKLPMLDDFEKEISIYSSLKQELLEMPQYINIGAVVIDAKSIRSFLLSLCANWIYTFCDYLQDKVILVLEDINFLVEKIEPEVCKIGQCTTDMSQLITNMRIFHNLRNKKSDIKQKFSTLQRANHILERFEFTLRPDIHEFYLTTPRKLDRLKTAFEMAMQKIRPSITSHKSSIIEELRAFQEEILTINAQFHRSDLFNSDCPSKDARELIEEFGHKISDLQEKSKDLCELQSFLDTPLVNLTSLQKLLDSYRTIRKVWLLVEEVTHTTKLLKRDMWRKQVPEEILQKLQELMAKVDKIPSEAMQWDITVSIIDYLDELKSIYPLLKLLQTSTIRDRHWKLILKLSPNPRVGSGTITDASILIKLSFGKLIDLGIHHCLQQVEAIVEKSKTEVTSESIISKFEEFWFGYIFKLEDYVRPVPNQPNLAHESDLSIPSSNSSNENLFHTPSGTIRRPSKGLHNTSKLSGINSIGLPEAPATDPIVKLANVSEVFETLDSHITELESVLNSPTSLAFLSDLKPWQLKFHRIETVLKMWVETQENWMLADNFFSWSDIRQQLSQEVIGFIVVDKQWRKLMKELQADPHVMRACYMEGRLALLEEINQCLEQTRSAIYRYFENFKVIYPRFYFISSAHIQTYIANLNDLKLLSRSIHMLFPGVRELDISTPQGGTNPTIAGVITTHGSSMQLNSPIHLKHFDKATSFLNEFSNNLHDTLRDYFSASIDKVTSEKPFEQLDISQMTHFLLSEMSHAKSSEIFLLLIRVLFSSLLQRLVSSNDVSQLKYTLSSLEKLNILVYRFMTDDSFDDMSWFSENIAGGPSDGADPDEASFQQEAITMPIYLRIQNFLMTLFYFKGVTQSLLAIEGDLGASFDWQSSVKHFIQEDRLSCTMSIGRTAVPYGFEFQGDFKEIVLTPNTDRCYSHLLQAVGTNYGGLLVGKQGSGKISTIKQFCYLMGRSLFEYSCSTHSSIEYLKDFIIGANCSKAIVCFRCIDNLAPNLLSIFVETIRASFSGSLTTNRIDSLSPNDSSSFSRGTVLATAQQYNVTSGDDSISGNVFIPHILMPDIRAITNFLLYVSGFQFSHDLSLRLLQFYEMYSVLVDSMSLSYLSLFKLRHLLIIASNKLDNNPFNYVPSYKLDLRSTSLTQHRSFTETQLEEISQRPKSTQRLISNDLGSNQDDDDDAKEREELKRHEFEIFRDSLTDYIPILACFLQETQISKLNEITLKLFSTETKEKIYLNLSLPTENEFFTQNVSLQKVLKNLRLEPDERFTAKVGEVWKALKLHHMVCLLGPSSSGKTSAINVCSSLFKDLNHSAVVHTILPQAIGNDKLFGTYDVQQQTWTKGLLTSLFANCFFSSVKNELDTRTHYWFHLDGTLDRLHCDILSTFNFEDYTLTLPSKQKMPLLPNARIIIECDNSEFLTPSMIAKLGIISFNSVLSWETILLSWLATQTEADSFEWKYLFEKYIDVIMTCLFPNTQNTEQHALRKLSSKTRKNLNRTQFTFAVNLSQVSLISSFISLLNSLIISSPNPSKSFKEVLLNFAAVWAIGSCLNEQSRAFFNTVWLELFQGPNTFPLGSNIWSYIPSPESQTFVNPRFIPFTYSKENLFKRMPFISNPESETIFCLLEHLSANNIPILISGDLGSGKSLLVERLFKSLEGSDFDQRYTLTFRCNALSTSSNLWSDLRSELVWNSSNDIYVPDNKMKLHYLIEDVHLIDVPNQESNSVTEMLRWIASGTELFDFETFLRKRVDLINFVVTCNSQLTSRNSRFTKHFFIHHYQYPSFDSQVSIFGRLLSWHFNCSPSVSKSGTASINHNFIKSIVSLSVELQSSLKHLFVQTQERILYIFTLRDIGNIFRSMCLILDVNCSIKDFIQLWNHEVYWTYEQRLVNSNDIAQFTQLKRRLIPKYFDSCAIKNYLGQPLEHFTFVKSALGHITIPHAHSLLSEYRVLKDKDKLQELVNRPFMKHSIKNWFALPFTLDLLNRISLHLFNSPDASNLLIIGKSQIASTVSLVASTFHFNLERISYHFASHSDETKSSEDHCTYLRTSAYNREVFDSFMKDLYTRAGVNMEKILLLLDYREMKNRDFFLRILEFVDNCQLSHLFSLEQRGNIVNALRTHVLRTSGVFSESLAWRIFLDNVKNNLKIIINVKRLDIQFYHIVYSMPSLFNRLKCIRCSQWNNAELGVLCEYSLKHYFPSQVDLKPKLRNIIIDLLPILMTDLCNNLNYSHINIPGNDSFHSFTIKFCKSFGSIYLKRLAQQRILQCAIQNLESIEKGKEKIESECPNREFVLTDKKASCTDLIRLIGQQSISISESATSLQRLGQHIDYLINIQPKLSDALQLAELESKNKIEAIVNSTKGINHENIEWLKAHSKDHEVSNILIVFVSLFKLSQDTLPFSRTIRRLLSNSERFISQIVDFHESNKTLSESNLISIQEVLTQDISTEYDSGAVLTKITQWLRAIAEYYDVVMHKLCPLEKRIELNWSSIEQLKYAKEALEIKISTSNESIFNLHSSLFQSSLSLTHFVNMYKEQNEDLENRAILIGDLGTLPEVWQKCSQISDENAISLIIATAFSYGYVLFLSAFPVEDQMNILLRVWPKSLAKLNLNCIWTDALNSRFNNLLSLDNLAHVMTSCKSEDSNSFLQIINALCYFIYNDDTKEYLTPLKPVIYTLAKKFLKSSFANWFSISSSSPYSISDLTNIPTHSEIDLISYNTHLYDSLRDAIVKGQPLLVKHLNTLIDPVLNPLFALAFFLSQERNANTPTHLAGRTIIPQKNFKIFFSRNTPSFCNPLIFSNSTYHINLSASHLLCHEVCLQNLLTNHSLYQSWTDIFSFVTGKESKIQSILCTITSNLAESFRCDIKTGTSYLTPDFDFSNVAYQSTQELVTLMRLRPYIQQLRDYAENSVKSVYSQFSCIPDSLAKFACSLCCIREMQPYYFFDINLLYDVMKYLFLENKLDQVKPSNLSQRPNLVLEELTEILNPDSRDSILEEYQTGINWPDSKHFDESRQLTQSLNETLLLIVRMFVKKAIGLYLPFLNQHDRFVFLIISSLIASSSAAEEEYSSSLIYSIIRNLSKSPLQTNNALTKVLKPDWIEEVQWRHLINTPLSANCVNSLLKSFSDRHTEWETWVDNNSLHSFRNMPIQVSALGEANCILHAEAVLISQALFPLASNEIYIDLIDDTLGYDFFSSCTHPISLFLTPPEADANIFRSNIFYFVTPQNSDIKSLTLQNELISFSASQAWEVKIFTHLEISNFLHNFDDDANTNLFFIKDFHLVKGRFRENFFTKAFNASNKLIKIVLCGIWSDDFPESLPEIINIIPIENIDFHLFSNVSTAEQIYPNLHHLFECIFNKIPKEMRLKIAHHPFEQTCYLIVLFHCSLITRRNCYFQCSHTNISITILCGVLEDFIQLKTNESDNHLNFPRDSEMLLILSKGYALTNLSPLCHYGLFSEQVLGISHLVIDNYLKKHSQHLLPTTNYFTKLGNLIKKKFSITTDIPLTLYTPPLPLETFPKVKSLPFHIPTLFVELEKAMKLLAPIPNELTVAVEKGSPLFYYVIANELRSAHKLLLDVSRHCTSLQHHLKTGVAFIPRKLIQIADSLSEQRVYHEFSDAYNPTGKALHFHSWLSRLIDHFNQLKRWSLYPLDISSALDLSCFKQITLLIDSMLKETQFSDISSDIIIARWHSDMKLKTPINKKYILNVRGCIDTFSNCIYTEITSESGTSVNIPLLAFPRQFLDSSYVNGEEEILNLKLDSKSTSILCSVSCPAGLTSS